jgi:hypothetical protein
MTLRINRGSYRGPHAGLPKQLLNSYPGKSSERFFIRPSSSKTCCIGSYQFFYARSVNSVNIYFLQTSC